MKKTLLLLCIISISGFFAMKSSGQETNDVITCSEFHITKPLRDLAKLKPHVDKDFGGKESEDRDNRTPQTFIYSPADGTIYGNDPTYMQTEMGTRKINGKATLQNWAGQTATGFRPFDPSGAAGPNHYIQMINSTTFKVYNKTGTTLLTKTLGTLWNPSTGNEGDPIVLYDKYADRWFLSQFGSTSNKKIYIAISTSADPLGTYYAYTFTSASFPDYLKFSIWENGYYMTSNQGGKMWCFERTQMLAGNAASRGISATFTTGSTSGFFCPLPADADGGLPPAGTPLPFVYYTENAWGGGAIDGVKIWNMTVNWTASPTASCTLAATIPTAAFDASYDSNWDDIIQPVTTQKLDGIGGVPTFRAQWRKWTGYNSLVMNWGVKISSTQRSIKWIELRQDQNTGVWSLYQEGTYTPDAHSRWMGSIAMDDNGSIALCYAKSSSTVYPSLCYTGRLATDPLGTMTFAEVIAIAGDKVQTSGNRFGDYSHTALDPDGITFWHTGEYIAGSNNAVKTRVYSFQLPTGAPMAGASIAITSGANPTCAGTSVTYTATATNGGTAPTYQWKVGTTNVGTDPTYTTTTITDGQVVTCVITSNLPGVLGNPATSNAITMNVNPVLVPSVSVSITSGTNPTCADASVTFTATTTNGGTTPAFQWKLSTTNVGTGSTYTTTTLTNGQVVTCELTSNATCATPTTVTSNEISMTINDIPPTPIISQAGMVLTSSSAIGNQWYLDGVIINGATSQSYTCVTNGNYTVVVTTNDCSSETSTPVLINVGINEINNIYGLSVFPNPNDGKFIVSFDSPLKSSFKLEIIDALGKQVFKENIQELKGTYSKQMNLFEFGKGIYTVSLTNDINETIKRIIVY